MRRKEIKIEVSYTRNNFKTQCKLSWLIYKFYITKFLINWNKISIIKTIVLHSFPVCSLSFSLYSCSLKLFTLALLVLKSVCSKAGPWLVQAPTKGVRLMCLFPHPFEKPKLHDFNGSSTMRIFFTLMTRGEREPKIICLSLSCLFRSNND